MSGMPRTLLEVIDKVVRARLAEVHTTLPGRIVSYDSAKQLANVRLELDLAVWDDDGERTFEEVPILKDIPVAFPRGGGCVITFPLAVDDQVIVFFSEAALGEWRTSGQHSQPSDARRMSLGWAWCVPGLYPDTKTLSSTDNAARQAGMVLGRDGANEQIRFANGEIKAGANASDYVALAPAVAQQLTLIKTALDTLASFVGGSNSYTTVGNVAATMLKAK